MCIYIHIGNDKILSAQWEWLPIRMLYSCWCGIGIEQRHMCIGKVNRDTCSKWEGNIVHIVCASRKMRCGEHEVRIRFGFHTHTGRIVDEVFVCLRVLSSCRQFELRVPQCRREPEPANRSWWVDTICRRMFSHNLIVQADRRAIKNIRAFYWANTFNSDRYKLILARSQFGNWNIYSWT